MTDSDPLSVSGSVVLVTGGAGKMGAGIAQRFSSLGATVALADLADASRTEVVAASLPGRSSVHRLDVRRRADCRRVVEEVLDRHGELHTLVNNAGINVRGRAESFADEDWDRVLDVNLSGAFRMATESHRIFAGGQGGSIVNVASTNGFIAVGNTVAYCVSKAGIIHLTRVLAFEWAHSNIRVNAVGPTIVETDMTADVRADAAYMRDKLSSIPLGKMATTADVANAVAYLASPAASMVTGQTLFIDGGATIH